MQCGRQIPPASRDRFSALQRAEIAEMRLRRLTQYVYVSFSALQRAEIAEIVRCRDPGVARRSRFSALQRAEIAEMKRRARRVRRAPRVSVLFNEPKLLKSFPLGFRQMIDPRFQCSSTSRNC